MNVAIVGSPQATYEEVCTAFEHSGFDPYHVLTVKGRSPHSHALRYAKEHLVSTLCVEVSDETCWMVAHSYLIDFADAVVVVWDGEDVGVRQIIRLALDMRRRVYVYISLQELPFEPEQPVAYRMPLRRRRRR